MRGIRTLLLVLFLATGVGAACTEGLPNPTEIDRLRVLGIRVDPPELRGEQPLTARLTALVVQQPGLTQAPSLSWYRCDAWEVNANAFYCPFTDEPEIALGAGPTLEYTVNPQDLLDLAAEQAAILAPGREQDIQFILDFLGVWDTVNLQVTAGNEQVEATKRIVASGALAGQAAMMMAATMPGSEACAALGDNVPPNTNPALVEVRYQEVGGEAAGRLDAAGSVSVAPGAELELHPVVDWDTLEPYPIFDVLGVAPVCRVGQEIPYVSWFCDGGGLASATTASRSEEDPAQLVRLNNLWTAPGIEQLPPGLNTVNCWVVLRDGRGGIDWQHVALTVEE